MGTSIYVIAFVVTAIIFIGVFSWVRYADESKIERLYRETTLLYEELQANKILLNYLNNSDSIELDAETCLVYERQVSRQLNKIYELFSELDSLDSTALFVSKDSVRRQYLLTSMSLWIDLKNTPPSCSLHIQPILYFFPKTENCVLCAAMQNQLEILKSECPNVRVFAFPAESADFEFVSLLRKEYGVEEVPALVINDEVFVEVQDTQDLKQLLACSS